MDQPRCVPRKCGARPRLIVDGGSKTGERHFENLFHPRHLTVRARMDGSTRATYGLMRKPVEVGWAGHDPRILTWCGLIPTSSLVSRNAAARQSASCFSTLPPGKPTCPGWCLRWADLRIMITDNPAPRMTRGMSTPARRAATWLRVASPPRSLVAYPARARSSTSGSSISRMVCRIRQPSRMKDLSLHALPGSLARVGKIRPGKIPVGN